MGIGLGKDINFDSMLRLDNIEAPWTTEYKVWINRFIAISMKENDLWKLEILRSFATRYTKTWNQSPNRLNEQNKLYGSQYNNNNETFNSIQRNVFFDIKFIKSNNVFYTSQSYGILQVLHIIQRKSISDENGSV